MATQPARISSAAEIDATHSPTCGFSNQAVVEGETESHAHGTAQLLYAADGVLTVIASGRVWVVPHHCALWIPSGIKHSGRTSGPVRTSSLYLEPDLGRTLEPRCGILSMTPLLRELLARFEEQAFLPSLDRARQSRLLDVLMDELRAAPRQSMYLPIPEERRLRRLVLAMIDDPSASLTVEEWGSRVGASNRTLSRLFQKQTGLSFTRWRQQLHVSLALPRLAAGDLVTAIAGDLGYESVSAFIAMFRRRVGTTPARYFADLRRGVSAR